MTNTKTTRKALLASVLSLVVCCAMLIGTTFAWFTDSVTSGRNTIRSGNLDAKLYYRTSIDADWTEVDSTTKIFNEEALYEPGYTEVVYLKVENAGSLAFKYQFGLNVVGETAGVNKAGASFKLSDYLKAGTAFGTFADRETAVAAATGNLKDLVPIDIAQGTFPFGMKVTDGILGAKDYDETHYPSTYECALVITMPTTVGNEANHDGEHIPSIQLGVSLVATQATVESDSFDHLYDKDAKYPIVTTAAELTEAVEAAGANDTVFLGNDITLSSLPQSSSGKTTINLSGHTLETTSTASMVVKEGDSLTIVGGTLKMNASNAYSASMGIEEGASVTVKDAEVISAGSAFYPRGNAASVTIENSTVTAGCYAVATNAATSDNYGVVITLKDSILNVSNGDNDNCAVLLNVPGTLNIDNCTITGQRQGVIVRAGTASISNSTITTAGSFTPIDKYYTGNWGSGNEVPAAALVVGNQHGNYMDNAVCSLNNTQLFANNGAAVVYMDANDNYSATLTATGTNLTEQAVTKGASTNMTLNIQ